LIELLRRVAGKTLKQFISDEKSISSTEIAANECIALFAQQVPGVRQLAAVFANFGFENSFKSMG
jgi:hypothetical protein